MTEKTTSFIAVRPVYDSTTGVYYEPGQEVLVRQSILDGTAPTEIAQRAKGGLVEPSAAALKAVREQASALPPGYDRKGTIQAQPGPQPDHRVPPSVPTVAELTAEPDEDAAAADAKVEVEEGGTSRAKPKAKAKAEGDVFDD